MSEQKKWAETMARTKLSRPNFEDIKFKRALKNLLNSHSIENDLGLPDDFLMEYLISRLRDLRNVDAMILEARDE